ncbi:MAG: glycosyltransferase family 9 protein [Chloroflexi bacterium]|nr:glycosyltransferase family 9 protein [Chloroflexota bacterium]
MLLLRPDHIGDVVLTSPAVQLLRDSLPRAHLTYVVGPWSVDAARCGPPVDDLRTLAYPGFTRRSNANLVQPYALLVREARRLRNERYDAAVVFRPDHWWGALLASVAGIPLRLGFLTPETRPFLTHGQALRGEHAAEEALGLARLALATLDVQACGEPGITFTVPQAARERTAAFWSLHGLTGRPVVCVQPTAGAVLKSWPIEAWVRLVDGSSEAASVVLAGAPADAMLLQAIQERCSRPPFVVRGESIADSAAVYERARLLVGVDGGAAHVAAAVGTPTVRVYGPAPVARYGPWPPRDDQRVVMADALACIPCGHLDKPPCGASTLPACMLAVSVEDVLREVRSLLFSQR